MIARYNFKCRVKEARKLTEMKGNFKNDGVHMEHAVRENKTQNPSAIAINEASVLPSTGMEHTW